jgi:hypothetical protein
MTDYRPMWWNVKIGLLDLAGQKTFTDVPYNRDFRISWEKPSATTPVVVIARVTRLGEPNPLEYEIPFLGDGGVIVSGAKIEIICRKVRPLRASYSLAGMFHYLGTAPFQSAP